MSQSKAGCQTIGCTVRSCKFNSEGCLCSLARIEVQPQCGCEDCSSGNPADESLCGSYKAR